VAGMTTPLANRHPSVEQAHVLTESGDVLVRHILPICPSMKITAYMTVTK
jgi:hypothetical protein